MRVMNNGAAEKGGNGWKDFLVWRGQDGAERGWAGVCWLTGLHHHHLHITYCSTPFRIRFEKSFNTDWKGEKLFFSFDIEIELTHSNSPSPDNQQKRYVVLFHRFLLCLFVCVWVCVRVWERDIHLRKPSVSFCVFRRINGEYPVTGKYQMIIRFQDPRENQPQYSSYNQVKSNTSTIRDDCKPGRTAELILIWENIHGLW